MPQKERKKLNTSPLSHLQNLPQIYWIPKPHKTPYKARFIAVSSSCTTTRLSKLITECLKLVRTHCTAYCKTIRVRTGVNCMWIINNSLDVFRVLEDKQLSLNHVRTWDFSTLYTSLPHAQLKKQLHDLLERVFNTKGKSFIATNNFRTFWTNDRTSTSLFQTFSSKRSDSGERCEVKKAIKSRGGLGREVREPSLTSPPPSLLFFRALFYFAPLPTI